MKLTFFFRYALKFRWLQYGNTGDVFDVLVKFLF